jgi:putative ABC transport system substrate-binding protein
MALPLPARAQRQERMRRIALLMNYAEGDTSALSDLLAFRQVLGELGWTEGQNIQFEYRWAAADADRMRSYARELVRLAPDVIVANTLPVAAAVKKETTTVPIVIAFGGDPVTSGLIANLAHPGGNITGFTVAETPLAGKWLELLKELVPDATRVAIIRAPQNPNLMGHVRAIDAANARHKLELTQLDANDSSQIGRGIDAFAQGSKGALMVLPGPSTFVYREAIISAAARSRVPAIYPFRFSPMMGGLRHTEPMKLMFFVEQHRMLIASFVGKRLATFPSRNRPSSSWSSTSRLRKRSASKFRQRSSRLPMR